MNVLMAFLAGLTSVVLLFLGLGFALASGSGRVVTAYFAAVLLGWIVAAWRRQRRRQAPPATWSVRARRSMTTLCLVLGAGVLTVVVANMVALRPPQQAELADWLRAHRAELERPREMLLADRVGAVLGSGSEYSRAGSLHFTSPEEAGLTTARAGEYRRLMGATGCGRVDVWSDGAVSFAYRSWGMANHGWRATLVWSPGEPSPLLPTIDVFSATRGPGSNRAFARIDDSWYAHIVW